MPSLEGSTPMPTFARKNLVSLDDAATPAAASAAGVSFEGRCLRKMGPRWMLETGNKNARSVWNEPPLVLDRLLLGLFAAQPEDLLNWLHSAVWRLRTEELLDERQRPERQDPGLRTHGSGFFTEPSEAPSLRSSRHTNVTRSHYSQHSSRQPTIGSISTISDPIHEGDMFPLVLPQSTRRQHSHSIIGRQSNMTVDSTILESYSKQSHASPIGSERPERVQSAPTNTSYKGSRTGTSRSSQRSSLASHLSSRDSVISATRRSSVFSLSAESAVTEVLSFEDRGDAFQIGARDEEDVLHVDTLTSSRKEVNAVLTGAAHTEPSSHTVTAKSSLNSDREDGPGHGYMTDFERYFGKDQGKKGLFQRSEKMPPESGHLNDDDLPSECGVLSPVGYVRVMWDVVFFFCLLCDLWATPMEIVFYPDPDQTPTWFDRMGFTILVFFCCDIVLNFFTGCVKNGRIVMQRKEIASNYIKGWFWFDLAATLPEIVLTNIGSGSFLVRISRGLKTWKMLRALRLLRAIRLIKTQGFANMIMMRFGPGPLLIAFLKVAQVCLSLLLLAHVHGSIWALMQPDDWKATRNEQAYDRYFESLWRVMPALTFGGELLANNNEQYVLTIIIAMERMCLLRFCIEHMLWLSFIQSGDAERFATIKGALAYLKTHRVSPALQLKVFQNLKEIDKVQNQLGQFNKLTSQYFPSQLKRLISNELWSERLLSFDIIHHLGEWEPDFVRELGLLVREEVMASKVVVFSAGESSHTAYHIVTGILCVTFHVSEAFVPDFTAGMWVGEKSFVNPELRRIQTVVCKVSAQLMTLEGVSFQEIVKRFGLKEKLDDLYRRDLWLGLCGRCGMLGNHFNHNCDTVNSPIERQSVKGSSDEITASRSLKVQSVVASAARSLRGARDRSSSKSPTRNSGKDRSGSEGASAMDLDRFLSDQGLVRLKSIMTRYGITCLNDLKISTINEMEADPDVRLTPSEQQSLSDMAIQKFQRKMKRACTQVLASVGNENNHLLFISHYKLEAGTEATLMAEDLVKIIESDPANPGHTLKAPVFLDTEELRDLNDLKKHVHDSHNLLLLLTPGVLTRPWCLVEIVVAINAGVRVVPVEVQRPNMQFSYPTEAWYRKIRGGKGLDSAAMALIHREGIDDVMLENAIRQVFMRIALPFSPHKTTGVRQAELHDIIMQCKLRPIEPTLRASDKSSRTSDRQSAGSTSRTSDRQSSSSG